MGRRTSQKIPERWGPFECRQDDEGAARPIRPSRHETAWRSDGPKAQDWRESGSLGTRRKQAGTGLHRAEHQPKERSFLCRTAGVVMHELSPQVRDWPRAHPPPTISLGRLHTMNRQVIWTLLCFAPALAYCLYHVRTQEGLANGEWAHTRRTGVECPLCAGPLLATGAQKAERHCFCCGRTYSLGARGMRAQITATHWATTREGLRDAEE